VTQEWHYHLGSDQHGPVSFEELQGLATSRQLTPSTLVWKDGMAEWVQASTIAGLLPATPPPPPVPEAIAPPAAPIAPPAAPIAPPAAPIAAPIAPLAAPIAPPAVAGAPPVSAVASGVTDLRGSVAQLKARLSLFQLIQLGGAAVLVLAMFLPYWSMTGTNDPDADRSDGEEISEILEDNRDWYEDHISKKKLRDYQKGGMGLGKDESVSLTIWGFSTATGWIGFFFGLLIATGVLLPLFIAPLQSWDWILALVAAGLALLVFIMSLLWLLGSPGADVPPIFSQGNSLGPYVVFLASAAVIAGATMLALEKLKSAKATTA